MGAVPTSDPAPEPAERQRSWSVGKVSSRHALRTASTGRPFLSALQTGCGAASSAGRSGEARPGLWAGARWSRCCGIGRVCEGSSQLSPCVSVAAAPACVRWATCRHARVVQGVPVGKWVFEHAVARHRAGDFDGALDPYSDVLTTDPGHAGLANLGDVLHRQGSGEGAIGLYRGALAEGASVEVHTGPSRAFEGRARAAPPCQADRDHAGAVGPGSAYGARSGTVRKKGALSRTARRCTICAAPCQSGSAPAPSATLVAMRRASRPSAAHWPARCHSGGPPFPALGTSHCARTPGHPKNGSRHAGHATH